MAGAGVHELVARPNGGRVFETTVPVRFGDTGPDRRLRLDALARILQDAGNDDFVDAGLDPLSPWVARRSVVDGGPWPTLGEQLQLATWCGGLGSRWAERRTSVRGSEGAQVEVATTWVHLDAAGRPVRLPGWFLEAYGDAAGGRVVSTRLRLGPPPEPGAGVDARPWPLRAADLDAFAHVNNAAVWAPVEDECARRRLVPGVAEVEFLGPLGLADEVRLRSRCDGGVLDLWLDVGGEVRVAARVAQAAGARNTAARQ